MTSAAFVLGVVPLVLADGAGAEMRRVLGTAVFSGMLGVTVFGIFLTPVFFVVVDWLTDRAVVRSGRIGEVLRAVRRVVLFGWLRDAAAGLAARRAGPSGRG